MYCQNCGKKIEDDGKFCPDCGCSLETGPENASDVSSRPDPPGVAAQNTKMKIWKGVVLAVAGVALTGVIVCFGMRLWDKSDTAATETQTDTEEEVQVSVDEQPSEAVEARQSVSGEIQLSETAEAQSSQLSESRQSESVEAAQYPQEMVLNEEQQDRLTRFIHILGEVDCRGGTEENVAELYADNKEEFGAHYLFYSLYNEYGIMETDTVTGDEFTYWEMSQEAINSYMQSTVNSTARNSMMDEYESDGYIYIPRYDPPDKEVTAAEIRRVTAISSNDIQLEGVMDYCDWASEDSNQVVYFKITMTENPDSMWGGYTLKSIDEWGSWEKYMGQLGYTQTELDGEVEQGITGLMEVLAGVDGVGEGRRFSSAPAMDHDIASLFINYSLFIRTPLVDDAVSETEYGIFTIPIETVNRYLKNSINYRGYTAVDAWESENDDGTITFTATDFMEGFFPETYDIDKAVQLSDQELEVFGNVYYVSDYEDPYTAYFDIILEKNPDSPWGGYTLARIRSWE